MIKDRIIQLIEYKGIAKENFYLKIGMTSASFRGKAKESPLNSNAIENILSEIPDVNIEWLLTGKGQMLKTPVTVLEENPTDLEDLSTYNIGDRIRDLRSNTRLNQSDLARLLNVDQSQYSKIENNKLLPTLSQVVNISKILQQSLDTIILGAEKSSSHTENYLEMYQLAKEQVELLKENKQMLMDELERMKRYERKDHQFNPLVAEPKSKLEKGK